MTDDIRLPARRGGGFRLARLETEKRLVVLCKKSLEP